MTTQSNPISPAPLAATASRREFVAACYGYCAIAARERAIMFGG
jgi:hypothetical protein